VREQREREVEILRDVRRRVHGLPPVLARERVQVEQKEKGQLRLDSLFKPIVGPDTVSEKKPVSAKRKCA
jgi:hypothetical protein